MTIRAQQNGTNLYQTSLAQNESNQNKGVQGMSSAKPDHDEIDITISESPKISSQKSDH